MSKGRIEAFGGCTLWLRSYGSSLIAALKRRWRPARLRTSLSAPTTPLRSILEEAGLSDAATEIAFTGLDRGIQGGEVQAYQRSLSRSEAARDEVLLAYEMNGEALQPQHGFPLRLLVPGWYGLASVKRLDAAEGNQQPLDQQWNLGGYGNNAVQRVTVVVEKVNIN